MMAHHDVVVLSFLANRSKECLFESVFKAAGQQLSQLELKERRKRCTDMCEQWMNDNGDDE